MQHFHTIVIGSGAGGSACASVLAQRGKSVLVLEKGHAVPPALALDLPEWSPSEIVKLHTSKEEWLDGTGRKLVPTERFALGGKTKFYGAALMRQSALEQQSWPRGVNLNPWYDVAEERVGVTIFPDGPQTDRFARELAPKWRSERLNLGLAPRILDRRFDATHYDGFATSFKRDAEHLLFHPNITVIEGSEVSYITDSSATLTDGRSFSGSYIVLAAGALHSPRLLQRYCNDRDLSLPPSLGHNLKLHLLSCVLAVCPRPVEDLLRKTRYWTCSDFPRSSIQPLGFGPDLIREQLPWYAPFKNRLSRNSFGFFVQTEDTSKMANRVFEDASGARVIDYDARRSPQDESEHHAVIRAFRASLYRQGYSSFVRRMPVECTAHACGTMRCGETVDLNGKVAGFNTFYVADGSVLPRIGRVNPALTIFAWGFRLGAHLSTL